ncbi:hypothetical protein DICPUDRAFT_149056 [Dictyostelium purpureum]|uniref:Uncharacterized protein n=1 Tax=Dictyostelium purpureum TaxID=5786 RepID=F0ZCQ4_DICPU|nr:uncharacterized protein DICPUDRAFT_149056 [Dictyostelium purpureum]EGC38241.1 hypothetical protein DICPUDRAFT_149056 [Dictyostelium purpureum]|eukprot:XP_003285198.1 hypothetical protein DICPUDRAFT_149056 [Dictyostelium purpureum]
MIKNHSLINNIDKINTSQNNETGAYRIINNSDGTENILIGGESNLNNNNGNKDSMLKSFNKNDQDNQIQLKEKYYLKKENGNSFSTLLPNELMPFFTFSDYHNLITSINNYKSPSNNFFIVMIVFESLLFLISTGLGLYFLSTANTGRSIAIGLFLLVLSILTLVGCSYTYFRKSKMSIDDIGDFYTKLNKKYESKNLKFTGVFSKKVYPKLGDNYYQVENNEVIIEYPKIYNAQGVLLYNLNTGVAQYLKIESNDNNDKENEKIPLLSPSSSINNQKL